MAELDALQHIYSNVEAEQSPSGRGGFQTLFASPGLTRDDISEIEERVVYFPEEDSPPKRVFHALSSGRVMLSHVTPLAGKDRHGRGGRYLAHTLVFERDAFEAQAGTPFAIFRTFAFVSTVDAALAAGDASSGQIPPTKVPLPADTGEAARAASAWAPEALTALATLAARAGRFGGEHVSIALKGSPDEVESAVEAACLALPHPLVPLCSFDTYFHGGNLAATYFWGIGVAQASRNPRVHNVDAGGRTATTGAEAVPDASYERWVARTIERREFPAAEDTRRVALSVCEWLDGKADACTEPAPDLLAAIFDAAADAVRAKLAAQVAVHLPPLLAPRAHQRLLADLDVGALYALLRAGADLATVAEALWKAYDKIGFARTEKDERKELGVLLETLDHRDLRTLHACWTGNTKGLRTLLEPMADGDYEQWVRRATRYQLVEPHELLLEGRHAVFAPTVTAALRQGLGEVDLPAIVDALVSAEGAGALDALIPLLSLADAGALKAILKRIRKEGAVSARFGTECEACLATAPKKPGFIARLRGRGAHDDEED